jgi:hypothetical protein
MSDTDVFRDPENGTRSILGRARLTFASESDIAEFVETLERYEAGELTSDQWRAFRLVRGVYGQRQDDVQMFRVKIPPGVLSAEALRALADACENWSRLCSYHNAPEHPAALHEVSRYRSLHAPTGPSWPYHTRGMWKLGAECCGLPFCRGMSKLRPSVCRHMPRR